MEFKSKNILIISPEGWGKSFVSKHHYASELARMGNHVFFLNPPSTGFKVRQENPNLTIVDYKNKYRGLGRLPKFLSAILIKKELKSIEQSLSTNFDIIWNFDSSRFFNLSKFSDKLRICHIVDMSENFHRDTLAQTADICFCTSDYIAKTLQPYNHEVHKIHHGYQLKTILKTTHQDINLVKSGEGIVQVGYVGNLSRGCIDWDVILALVEHFPKVQFNFIGAYQPSNLARNGLSKEILNKLKTAKNVHLLGAKESHLIPSYLAKFDILLCVYKMESDEDYAQHSNLHKTMEYMGSGKVIVTSYVDEYKNNLDLLQMCTKNEAIVPTFEETLKHLDNYNAPSLQAKRKAFAAANSYAKQIQKIASKISQL